MLQQYGFLWIVSTHNSPLNCIISVWAKETKNLWKCCCIPMKDYAGCQEVVKKCVSRWTSAKKATKANPAFSNELNTLLDLRLASC